MWRKEYVETLLCPQEIPPFRLLLEQEVETSRTAGT